VSDETVDSWDMVREAIELARRGEELALATVVWRQAPSSGQQGARAIVTSYRPKETQC
jgi:xanthine dehydrogenase accessory factor